VGPLEDGPPRYLVAELGGLPASPSARAVWQTAAARIERYRSRYGIDDPKLPLGPEPQEREQRAEWQVVSEAIDRAVATIDQYERGIDLPGL
jgi:hypothetical protein